MTSWQWSTFVTHDLKPYYFERSQFARGRRMARAPSRPISGVHQTGVDAEGRVVVERQLTEFKDKVYETFYVYEPTHVVCVHYSYWAHEPINASVQVWRDGRPVRTETAYATAGPRREIYRYEGELLTRIEIEVGENAHVDELTYDRLGRLERIDWVHPTGERSVRYRRPRHPVSLAALLALAQQRLLEAIPRAVRALRTREHVYALALVYNLEQSADFLPPLLGIATEPERQGFRSLDGPEAIHSTWSSPEWLRGALTPPQLETKPLLALFEEINQRLWQK